MDGGFVLDKPGTLPKMSLGGLDAVNTESLVGARISINIFIKHEAVPLDRALTSSDSE